MAIILNSIDSQEQPVYSVREHEMINKLRTLLKDTISDQLRTLNTLVEEHRGQRWSDSSLLIYLNQAMNDMNATPPQYYYDFENFPSTWEAPILLGGEIFALISESILQVGW